MYSIYVDNVLIYSDVEDNEELNLISPKLKLSDNAAGSLEFTIPAINKGYNSIIRMKSVVRVDRDGKEIWEGRPLTEKADFQNNKQFTCEGELAYLNDTTQPQAEYHGETVRSFLEKLINIHNQKASANRHFTVGAVSVSDPNDSLYRYTNNESTLECINDKLVSRLGGHIRIRKENGVRYIDYLKECPKSATQEINFGENLLDFTKTFDMSGFSTVILPLGERLEESPIEALEAYVTVESVNDGSPYVVNTTAVNQYGWIETVIHWDDVSEPANLLRKAQDYLNEVQFDNLKLEVSAIDMSYLTDDDAPIDLLDEIHCVSEPHGLNKWFPVLEIDIDLSKPQNTVYKLGTNEKKALSTSTSKARSEILKKLELIPDKSSFLEEARENATEIMQMATNGYVTLVKENGAVKELIIANHQDYTQADKLWRWNINGLGHSKNGYDGEYGLAMTMDGSIVADYITSGTMTADIIRAGILRDKRYLNYWNLDTGEFRLSSYGTKIDGAPIDEAIESVAAQQIAASAKNNLRWKINYSDYSTKDYGSCYYYGLNYNGQEADVPGYVTWIDDKLVSIPKGRHVKPSQLLGLDVLIYNLYRTSDKKFYDVTWNDETKTWMASNEGSLPGAWDWNETTDIILSSYKYTVNTSSGRRYEISYATLYSEPLRYSDLPQKIINDIQEQVDGLAVSWFYDYDPTLSNYPASEWTTDDIKHEHVGDTFYNTTSGYAYKFVGFDNNVLEYPYYASGTTTWSSGSYTINSDGTITVNGETPGTMSVYVQLRDKSEKFVLPAGTYRFTLDGIPESSISWGAFIVNAYKDGTQVKQYANVYDQSFTILDSEVETFDSLGIQFVIRGEFDNWVLSFGILRTDYKWVAVTDAGVAEAMRMAAQAQDTADGKRRVFIVTPFPPYDVGDLWMQGSEGDILTCTTSKSSSQTYSESDWSKLNKYISETTLEEYAASIEHQLDGKAETWYQESDPSTTWKTVDLKTQHTGDLWYNSSENVQKYYRWDGTHWLELRSTPPGEVFDKIDGKAQVFVTTPTPPYNVGDLWMQGSSGDILTCIAARDSGTFQSADWEKRDSYADKTAMQEFKESIGEQIDGKAETWYQTSDPSQDWTTSALRSQHKGDLWYNSSSNVQKYYRWNGSSWSELKTTPPDTVFDRIDGKAQVFITTPTPPYNIGDLWFESKDSGIRTCIVGRSSGSYVSSDWQYRNHYAVNDMLYVKYGTCATDASTVAKVVSLPYFELYKGSRISVKFTYGNTASNPTLNVNGKGAKPIYVKNSPIEAKYFWTSNSLINFTYDGEHWLMEAEDQEEVFKRLTNNGAAQGITLTGGKLYLNATYINTGTMKANFIHGGTLNLGGSSNANGILELFNASNVRTGRWDNGAFYFGNIGSNLNSPNTKIDSSGAVNTKSLTASEYVHVNGNTNSYIKIPIRGNSYSEFGRLGFHTYTEGNGWHVRAGQVPTNASDVVGTQAGLTVSNSAYDNASNRVNIYSDQILVRSGGQAKAYISTYAEFMGHVYVSGNLVVQGSTKQRMIQTRDYGKRSFYSYETATPMFGDIGEGIISEDGKCYIQIDDIFAESVSLSQYQVFLQKYGNGDCWVSSKKSAYFIVEGTPGLKFGWEIKAKQADTSQLRLEQPDWDFKRKQENIDYAQELANHIDKLQNERGLTT